MQYDEAKEKFIQAWGTLGNSWGINRTMSQIHALLIATKDPLSTEEIMEELKVSRGNVNMNVRTLMEWGLLEKKLIAGERKEYFAAGKDIGAIARKVAKERRRRELEPVIAVVEELQKVEGKDEQTKEFNRTMKDLKDFTVAADNALAKFIRMDNNWFFKTLMRFLR